MGTTSAIILAGGRGTRMDIFCSHRPKPVLPFGGQYRVVDFTLSNCVNSQIEDIAVLVDYQRQAMADYLVRWNFTNQLNKSLAIRPPLSDSYSGTAGAVYQNLDYLKNLKSDRILILAGDHVYTMDYRRMLAFHNSVKADVTVGVVRVPLDKASRFGTVDIDISGRITDFVEKSPSPRSNLASMGIYIFNSEVLARSLSEDAAARDSIHDFGYSILPMITKTNRVFAYEFKDYWQDIGTVEAYYEANMELLKPQPQLKFRDDWPVFSAAKSPPGDVNGRIINSIISPGCVVEGYVENSILSPGVYVDKQAEVINSIVMDNTSIGYHSIVDRCMLDEDVMIGGYCYLGFGSSPVNGVWDITLLGKEVNVPPQTSIGRKCKILPGLGLNAFASRMVSSGTVVSASV